MKHKKQSRWGQDEKTVRALVPKYSVSHSLQYPALKILQRNLNRSTFIVWEMKRNVSVVPLIVVTRSSNIHISGNIIKEMPGSVASGTHCIYHEKMNCLRRICGSLVYNTPREVNCHIYSSHNNERCDNLLFIFIHILFLYTHKHAHTPCIPPTTY